MKVIRLVLAAIVLLLSACSSTPTTQPETPPPTSAPTSPPTLTAITTPSPTPVPTLTPTATSTPSPTASPSPVQASIPVPAEVTAWLLANAVPFDTPLPGHGCDDLRPLLAMIGDARVVALGEATHGTSEFFTMKHRLFECLVQEKGFNILAMELGDPDLSRIDAYVRTGQDVLEAALGGAWSNHCWMNTREVTELVSWMRAHNQNPGNAPQVSLRGFDVTFSPTALQEVPLYVSTVDPARRQRVWDDLDCFRQGMADRENYPHLDADTLARCQKGVEAVYDLLLAQAEMYRAVSSPEAYDAAVAAARTLVQSEQLLRLAGDYSGAMNLRDKFMAENAAWLLEQAGPRAKIVLWAHNGHIQTSSVVLPLREYPPLPPEEAGRTFIPMGVHLRAEFGDALMVIGFSFQSGHFRAFPGEGLVTITAPELIEFRAQPPLPNSHEAYLYPQGLDRYYLDLRALPDEGVIADWFGAARHFRTIGSIYDADDPEVLSHLLKLPEAFDIVIGFRETTASRTR